MVGYDRRTDVGQDFPEGPRKCIPTESGAGDGIRTRNPQLGKLMRYRCATPAQVSGEDKDHRSGQMNTATLRRISGGGSVAALRPNGLVL